jgi:uncharacterized membrane protein (Fun14 family)
MQMSGQVEVKGELDVGGIFPSMFGLFGEIEGDVNARLAGVLSMSGQLAVQLPSVSAALEALAAVEAQLTSGGVSLSFAVQADVIASLSAQAALIAGFLLALGNAKAEVFTYSGDAASFASACGGQVSGGIQGGLPSDQCQALVFVTRYPAFMDALFKLVLA